MIEERLVRLGDALLHWTLDSESMALMRLAMAKARRFPDLASTVSQTARQLSTEVAAGFLGEMAQSGELAELPAFAPERLATTVRFFLDLVVVPMLLRGAVRSQNRDGTRRDRSAHRTHRPAPSRRLQIQWKRSNLIFGLTRIRGELRHSPQG